MGHIANDLKTAWSSCITIDQGHARGPTRHGGLSTRMNAAERTLWISFWVCGTRNAAHTIHAELKSSAAHSRILRDEQS